MPLNPVLCRHLWSEMTDLIRAIGRHWLAALWLCLQFLLAGYLVYLDANPRRPYFAGIGLDGGFSEGFGVLGLMSLLLFPGIWVVSAFLQFLPGAEAGNIGTTWLLAGWLVAAVLTYLFWLIAARWARSAMAQYRGTDRVSTGSPK